MQTDVYIDEKPEKVHSSSKHHNTADELLDFLACLSAFALVDKHEMHDARRKTNPSSLEGTTSITDLVDVDNDGQNHGVSGQSSEEER